MKTPSFLSKYFTRIGYDRSPQPNLQTLREIHLLHVKNIPFENLNPLLKLPVPLDMESIINKMVYHRRGGYCFEQNLLFQHVLNTIGFETMVMPGRVLMGRTEKDYSAQTHMLVSIKIEGVEYISDVGFGSQSLTGPIALINPDAQSTPHEDYRITPRENYYLLEVRVSDEWRILYRFEHRPWHFIDYKVANWYTSTHPDSHFTQTLTVAIACDDCRHTLRDRVLKTHFLQGETITRDIQTHEELIQILDSVFNIEIPDDFEPNSKKSQTEQ